MTIALIHKRNDTLTQLKVRANALLRCDAPSREARLAGLCLDYHAFVAAYLKHLDDEERTMLPQLGERVPSIGMVAMNAATLPLAERTAFLDKLLPCITPSEARAVQQALAEALEAAQ